AFLAAGASERKKRIRIPLLRRFLKMCTSRITFTKQSRIFSYIPYDFRFAVFTVLRRGAPAPSEQLGAGSIFPEPRNVLPHLLRHGFENICTCPMHRLLRFLRCKAYTFLAVLLKLIETRCDH